MVVVVVGGVKWHCSLNDPEQMSLSQRQTAPEPFRIKLGHTQRERQRGGEGEGANTNEEDGKKKKKKTELQRGRGEALKRATPAEFISALQSCLSGPPSCTVSSLCVNIAKLTFRDVPSLKRAVIHLVKLHQITLRRGGLEGSKARCIKGVFFSNRTEN